MGSSFYAVVVFVAALVIWRRTRAMYTPIKGNGARLLVPILFMLPALLVVLNPKIHAESWEWLAAFAVGAALSVPLIWTTNYEVRQDGRIYAQKNIGFIAAFLGVLAVRFGLRTYMGGLDSQTLAALFVVVALGYIIPWRLVSFLKFRKIYQQSAQEPYSHIK